MGKFFNIIAPPPLDTDIPDQHDFIFIKEVDTTNGILLQSLPREDVGV